MYSFYFYFIESNNYISLQKFAPLVFDDYYKNIFFFFRNKYFLRNLRNITDNNVE